MPKKDCPHQLVVWGALQFGSKQHQVEYLSKREPCVVEDKHTTHETSRGVKW